MSIAELKNDLKLNRIRKAYLFWGPEEYLKSYYLHEIERRLLNDDAKNMNYSLFSEKVDADRLMEACDAPPVFSDRRVVVVKGTGIFKSKKAAKKGKNTPDNTGRICDYLSRMPEETCLIFVEDEIEEKSLLAEAVGKYGLVVEFTWQKPEDLTVWVRNVFKKHGKDIDARTASYLIEQCDEGMNRILGEVLKLVNYVGERSSVTKDDIDCVCIKSLTGRVFDLTDAMAEGNAGKALQVLDDLVNMKEAISHINYMVAKHFRNLLKTRLLKEKGRDRKGISEELKVAPFVAGKYIRQCSRFTTNELKSTLMDFFEADFAVKTGRMDDRTALEVIISKRAQK